MSDTTAMIDVTATMFPSTVRNDRSLFVQMAFSAMPAASKNWFMVAWRRSLLLDGARSGGGRFHLDRGAVGELAHRGERADDHVVAVLHARQDLEVLVPGDA